MNETKPKSRRVSAIVPARNEEAVIAACVESLVAQEAIEEIIVVDDQSTDGTAEVVRGLISRHGKAQIVEAGELPGGWVGKNHAAWKGAGEAKGEWLLFTDADAVHEKDSAVRALTIAAQNGAAMVSFSPEQVMQKWYEKALIPYVYCRLGAHYSFADVNTAGSRAAAANGQFLMIHKDAYDAVGGHASVAGEVLEDVALAKKMKGAGQRIWFGSGKGIVRVRMYRSFAAMWEGWKKNLYPLMGGTPKTMAHEFVRAVSPLAVTIIAAIAAWEWTGKWASVIAAVLLGCTGMFVAYGRELRRNGFAPVLLWWGVPGRLLFGAILLASNRRYEQGKLGWKGREYPVGRAGASNRR